MSIPKATPPSVAGIELLAKQISDHLHHHILPFWLRFARDNENGGFWGKLAADGTADKSACKGLVQHARYLWSFSAFYQHQPRVEFKDFADHGYRFLTENFYDPQFGGYYYHVTAVGKPLVLAKHIYANSFVIFAFARYARVFDHAEAKERALQLADLLERYARDDRFGGYHESFTRDWQPADQLTDFGIAGRRKTMNSHIHMMEAYSELYRTSQSAGVEHNLQQIIDIILTKVYDSKEQSLGLFFEPDWRRIDSITSFGHDIETAWLLVEASKTLAGYRWQEVRSTALSLITQVLANGLDHQTGGVFNEKHLTAGIKTAAAQPAETFDRSKVWWVQAEAMVGFLTAWRLTNKQDYWDAFHNVLNWILNHQVDREFGDWYNVIDVYGNVIGDKASVWKACYHNGRACLEILHHLDDWLRRQSNLA